MANKLLKTLDFGNGDTYNLAPSWNNVQDKPFETVVGDTLTWDGNTSGLENLDGVFYKVSDLVPTVDETTAYSLTLSEGSTITNNDVPAVNDGFWVLGGECAFIFSEDDVESGITKGIYFIKAENGDGSFFYVTSLTINGYTGFTKEVIKEECLPEQTILYTDGTYMYKDKALTTKVTKYELRVFNKTSFQICNELVDRDIVAETYYNPTIVVFQSSLEYGAVQVVEYNVPNKTVNGYVLYTAEYTG